MRPWWGNPAVWLVLGVISILLGVFVAPHFLGGIVLFFPFIWLGRWTRQPHPEADICPRCGHRADPHHSYCPYCGTTLR